MILAMPEDLPNVGVQALAPWHPLHSGHTAQGQSTQHTQTAPSQHTHPTKVGIDDFELLKVLGKGKAPVSRARPDGIGAQGT